MKFRMIANIVLAVVSSGCALAAIGDQQAAINAHIASNADQACEMVARQVEPTCSESSVKSLSYVMAGDEAAKSVESAKMRCDMSAAGQARSKELADCMGRLRAGTAAERELQQQRLPAERKNVPAVRAEPTFNPLATEYANLDHEALVASDNLKVARAEGNPNVHRYQQRYDEISAQRSEVRGKLNKIYESHGIDVRDAPLLGLP